jgi:hypothetical protein
VCGLVDVRRKAMSPLFECQKAGKAAAFAVRQYRLRSGLMGRLRHRNGQYFYPIQYSHCGAPSIFAEPLSHRPESYLRSPAIVRLSSLRTSLPAHRPRRSPSQSLHLFFLEVLAVCFFSGGGLSRLRAAFLRRRNCLDCHAMLVAMLVLRGPNH